MEGAGEGPAGAGEVDGDGGRREPGGGRLEAARGRVRGGAVLQLGDHLFHDGVAPVITLGVRQRQAVSVNAAWQRQAVNSSPWPSGTQ